MTQDAVQFSGAVFIGSDRASTDCFNGRHVNPLPDVTSHSTWKRASKKVLRSTSSIGPKASPMPGVTLNHPQSAYTGLKKSLQQEWALVQRVTPGIGDAFGPMEEVLRGNLLTGPLPGTGGGNIWERVHMPTVETVSTGPT